MNDQFEWLVIKMLGGEIYLTNELTREMVESVEEGTMIVVNIDNDTLLIGHNQERKLEKRDA